MRLVLSLATAVLVTLTQVHAQSTVVLGIYGANKVEIPPAGGAKLIGFSYTSADTVYLEDVFGTASLTQDSSPSSADAAYLWDDALQGFVSYFQKGDGLFYKVSDPNGSSVSVSVESGDALFLRSPAGAASANTFYLSGAVSLDSDQSLNYEDTVCIANLYPTDLNLNGEDVDWSAATAGDLPTLGDQVHIWNPDKAGGPGFENYFLKNVGGLNEWYSGVSPFAAADPVIPAGGGAVYTAVNSFTNSIIRPFDI